MQTMLFNNGSEHELLLLDLIPISITFFDQDLRVVWANKMATDSMGIELMELVGKYCPQRDVHCDQSKSIRLCEKVLKTGTPEKVLVRSSDGKEQLNNFPL